MLLMLPLNHHLSLRPIVGPEYLKDSTVYQLRPPCMLSLNCLSPSSHIIILNILYSILIDNLPESMLF